MIYPIHTKRTIHGHWKHHATVGTRSDAIAMARGLVNEGRNVRVREQEHEHGTGTTIFTGLFKDE